AGPGPAGSVTAFALLPGLAAARTAFSEAPVTGAAAGAGSAFPLRTGLGARRRSRRTVAEAGEVEVRAVRFGRVVGAGMSGILASLVAWLLIFFLHLRS